MEALEIRMRELIAKNDDIMRRVECAKLQGGSASNEVTNWLQEVESMKQKVSDTQRNFAEQKNCWKGRFPNYYRRRKISKKSSILIGQVDDLITKGKFENGVVEPLPLASNALPRMPIVGKTTKLTKREILNCILGMKKKIIGVHGMGGVGKTTIMRNIHNDLSQQSESKHFDCFIWIIVSNDVDVNKLQRKIAKELTIDMEEDDDEDGATRKIFNALKWRKKFLLILDDMWKQFDLVEVGIPIPSEENGCKVVLTTRDKGICSLRVLNLSSTNIKSLPNSVSNLKNLRALILKWCRDLEEVPSLEKLEELRVLDLSGTKIRAAIRSGSNGLSPMPSPR
ncbi:hypothetical protein MRB53_009743 [Persea americana]|uniref:Uncharacterized protein n=1 Tax=Persea americana TaxID=3435 RepID=A0ACC2LPZ2_PERAE|nr:hypothetical protein MRB53_009743 [Persea americana]